MPVHGVIVGTADHDEAFSLLEAVENNSKFILFRDLLKTSVLVNKVFENLLKSPVNKNDGQSPAYIRTTGPASGAEKKEPGITDTYVLETSMKILTTEDILNIVKNSPVKKIQIDNNCKVTDFAEAKAAEIGVQIVRQQVPG